MDHPWNQPLSLDGATEPRRWQLGRLAVDVQLDGPVAMVQAHRGGQEEEPTRFLTGGGSDLVLTARTSDRSVVARPSVRLVVLANGHAVVYVSSPVWVGLAEQGADPFVEHPTVVPKRTWLGATPQAGELAYATRTQARVDLAHVDIEAGRAITQVELVNHLPEPWPIERIVVPVPHLALYRCGDRGELWTSSVRIERTGDDEVDAEVTAGPPDTAGPAERIAEPRHSSTPRMSLLALGRWAWS